MQPRPPFPYRLLLDPDQGALARRTWWKATFPGNSFPWPLQALHSEETVHLPVGILGPIAYTWPQRGLRQAWLPLATSEGALVASYQRGARCLLAAGGAQYAPEEGRAWVRLSPELSQRYLSVSPAELYAYWQISYIGAQKLGTPAYNGHVANGLTAWFEAMGWPLRPLLGLHQAYNQVLPPDEEGSVVVQLSLPSLTTPFSPEPSPYWTLLSPDGPLPREEWQAMAATLSLAGELSIMAAIIRGDFARAHRKLGRAPLPSAKTTVFTP